VERRFQIFSLLLEAGANPTIASYNASVVKIHNAMGSPARFENENIFFFFKKSYDWLQILKRNKNSLLEMDLTTLSVSIGI
jgi:hypothetical protein